MKTHSERVRHRRSVHLEFLEDRNLLSPVPAAPPAEVRQAQVTLPIELSFEGTRTITKTYEDQPNVYDLHVSGEGKATQLGRFALEEDHHVEPGSTPGSLVVSGRSATFTMPSGEHIVASYGGTGQVYRTDTGAYFTVAELDYTIQEGTGRYTGATGTFHVTLTSPTFGDNVTVHATGDGEITLRVPPQVP